MMSFDSQIALKKASGFNARVRTPPEQLMREIRLMAENPVISAVLDASQSGMLVLDPALQIVAANHRFIDRLAVDEAALRGKRLGEALGCENATVCEAGCGGAPKCAFCGALRAMLSSRSNAAPVTSECHLNATGELRDSSLELSITATPIEVDDQSFTVVSLTDMADKNRRAVLERLFVHDLKNGLQGVIGWSELLAEDPDDNTEKVAARIAALTRQLGEALEAHRMLVAAEADELTPQAKQTSPVEVAARMKNVFAHHQVAYGKRLIVDDEIPSVDLWTDPAVLDRVLVNMIKNAFEATEEDGAVRLGAQVDAGRCRFSVWNSGKMPDDVAAHVFKRSFSTKSTAGRGLGAYSMKLFGEKILGGRVYFETSEAHGTTFFIDLPQSLSVE